MTTKHKPAPLPLQALPNIGPEVAAQLQQAGIETEQQLRATGTETAFIRLKTIFPDACLHRLMAIEGAIRGIRKHHLPPERKLELTNFFRQLK